MIAQREVPADQICETVEASAIRNTPIAVTCCLDGTWHNYRSRFLGLRGQELWIEYAAPESGQAIPELLPGMKLGLAFKQRHHKFVFTSPILAVADFQLSPDLKVRGLRIEWPRRMQRLQRRSFYRASIPADKPVFCEMWQGGLVGEPKGALREKLVFNGQLVDLSAGGMRLRLVDQRDPAFHVGDAVGVILQSACLREPVRVDAQFRHAATDEFGLCLGLQFVGLNETSDGRKAFQAINQLVCDFQRIELRRQRSRLRGTA